MKTIYLLCIITFAFFITSCEKSPERANSSIETPLPAVPPDTSSASEPDPNGIIETAPPISKAVSVTINSNIGGYVEALPALYSNTTKKYPLLLFLHGAGEVGNGTTDLSKLVNGVVGLIKTKRFPASFTIDGINYSFIVLMPQFKNRPTANDVNDMLNHALTQYRIDASRVYISGLSMGGGVTWDFSVVYGNKVAAIVPMSGDASPSDEKAQRIAGFKLPIWAFHNQDDEIVTVTNTTEFINLINALNPSVKPKMTLQATGGHDTWTTATDPDYKENNKNIYEWMLQYTNN